jgi:hypothetical protein
MPEQDLQVRMPETAEAPPAVTTVAGAGYPDRGLDACLEALGVPADVLAEARKQAR